MHLSSDVHARRRLVALLCVAGVALLAGLAVGAGGGGDDTPKPAADRSPAAQVAKARLSLRQQVGQVLVSSFDGVEVPDYMRRRLKAGETAGVILFGKNVLSRSGLRQLTRSIQQSAGGSALVAADQEGGTIRSIPFAGPVPAQPNQGEPKQVESTARSAASDLRGLGVNVNLAPVADVSSAGGVFAGRTFPGGPDDVGARVKAFVRGTRAGGVAATAKHFPGIGAATANTDDAPVTIDDNRVTIEDRDLPPFEDAIGEQVPLIMASHVLYPAYDRGRIASQSGVLLRFLLRQRMHFRGVIVTDSLEAAAVLRRSNVAVAAQRSIDAGADLVLMTGSGSYKDVYPALLARARSSASFRARIREAAGRVLELKRRLRLKAPSR
jgi:beta-N-acetylhexosaminidase